MAFNNKEEFFLTESTSRSTKKGNDGARGVWKAQEKQVLEKDKWQEVIAPTPVCKT